MNRKLNARTIALFLTLAFLLLVSSACGSSTSPTLAATSAPTQDSGPVEQPTEAASTAAPVEQPTEAATTVTEQNYNIGDVITVGNATLTVNEVQYPSGDQSIQPPVGFKFLVVDITIENKGGTPISFSSFNQPTLNDASGQSYFLSQPAVFAAGGSSPDGEIAPGEVRHGQVGFNVPENATGFVFVFDAREWGAGKVFVALP